MDSVDINDDDERVEKDIQYAEPRVLLNGVSYDSCQIVSDSLM